MVGRGGVLALLAVLLLSRNTNVVTNHLRNDEVQELLGELGVQAGLLRHSAQTGNLGFLAAGVARRQIVLSLEQTHALRGLKTLRQNVHEGRIEVVDGAAHREKLLVDLGRNFIAHGGGVRVKFAGRVFGGHRFLLRLVVVFCALHSSRLLRQQLEIAGVRLFGAASRRW